MTTPLTTRTAQEEHALTWANHNREWITMVRTDDTGENVIKTIRVQPSRVAEAERQGWVIA